MKRTRRSIKVNDLPKISAISRLGLPQQAPLGRSPLPRMVGTKTCRACGTYRPVSCRRATPMRPMHCMDARLFPQIATYARVKPSQPSARLARCFSGFLATLIRSHRMSCTPCETDSAIHASQFNTKSFDDQAFFTGRFASHRATWIPPFSGPANEPNSLHTSKLCRHSQQTRPRPYITPLLP